MRSFCEIPVADLLDWARWQLGAPTDRALAIKLSLPPPTLSKLRRGQLPVGPALLVRLLEATDTSLQELPVRVGAHCSQAEGRCPR